jgi:ribosomal protein L11 methylase PrmA
MPCLPHRLQVLEASWFKGADVLDVGCNEGLMTLTLAAGCGCRSVHGVDIDPTLIGRAAVNQRRALAQLRVQLRQAVAARCVCHTHIMLFYACCVLCVLCAMRAVCYACCVLY